MEIFTRKEGGQRGKRKERLFGARTLICVCVCGQGPGWEGGCVGRKRKTKVLSCRFPLLTLGRSGEDPNCWSKITVL